MSAPKPLAEPTKPDRSVELSDGLDQFDPSARAPDAGAPADPAWLADEADDTDDFDDFAEAAVPGDDQVAPAPLEDAPPELVWLADTSNALGEFAPPPHTVADPARFDWMKRAGRAALVCVVLAAAADGLIGRRDPAAGPDAVEPIAADAAERDDAVGGDSRVVMTRVAPSGADSAGVAPSGVDSARVAPSGLGSAGPTPGRVLPAPAAADRRAIAGDRPRVLVAEADLPRPGPTGLRTPERVTARVEPRDARATDVGSFVPRVTATSGSVAAPASPAPSPRLAGAPVDAAGSPRPARAENVAAAIVPRSLPSATVAVPTATPLSVSPPAALPSAAASAGVSAPVATLAPAATSGGAAPPAAETPRVGVEATPSAAAWPPNRELETSAIENVLGRYRTAFNRLDAGAASAVWPSVNEKTLARAFERLEGQDVSFANCKIEVRAVLAEAACSGTARYTPKVGGRTPRAEPRHWTFSLRKANDAWLIDSVEAR